MKKDKTKSDFRLVKRAFVLRVLKFTETIVVWLTILYILNWVASVGLIIYAIYSTSNFSYLDTLIIETSTTFREIVGIAIIKFGVENIFKYNDFGGRVPSKPVEEEFDENLNEEMEDSE